MFKLKLCAVSISFALLTACEGDTLADLNKESENEQLIPSSKIVYSPADGQLSVPNDLLFNGTTDGTLNLPVVDASDYTDPTVAMSGLDGWSYQQPFLIEFELESRVESLNMASVEQAGSIRLFEAVMGASTDSAHPECAEVTQGLACKVLSELTFGVDFVTKLAANNQIAVVPLKPLNSDSHYLIAVTNQLSDSEGRAVKMSDTYRSVRQDLASMPLATDAQRSLQAIVNSFEATLNQAGVDKNSLILTAAMTTQSAPALAVLKQLLVQNPAQMPVVSTPNQVEVMGQGITARDALNIGSASCPDMLALAQSGQASAEQMAGIAQAMPFCISQLYSANITLPYYSGVATVDNPTGATGNNAWWQANCDSGATLQGAVAGGMTLPAAAQSDNDAFCMNFGLRDLGLDTERHITQYNPIPKVKTYNQIDVQITVPDPVYLTATGAQITQMPESGWPVIIMQHGIGSNKENMLALTGALGFAGFATVSIDMTLHGSRGFDLDQDGNYEIQSNPDSVTAFMNLENARATRDNIKQSVADLLGLRIGLSNLSTTNFNSQKLDNSNVYFIGHSLGGIVGADFIALTNTALNPAIDPLFKVNASVFANSSGGIASFLLASNSFGNFIKGNILLASFKPFLVFLAQNQQNIALLLADQTAYTEAKTNFLNSANLGESDLTLFNLAEGYFIYLIQNGANVQSLTASDHLAHFVPYFSSLNLSQQSSISAQINQFAFAMQTVIDSADPNQYTSMLNQTNTPILMTEIWGNGTASTWDQTIPPMVSGAPLSGTEALASQLNLSKVNTTTTDPMSVSGLVRFNAGGHSSLLSPSSSAAVTKEMQQMIATYFASSATVIKIDNSSVISD
ncbi:lipase [Catenovulum sp. 2E275]|uniref:VolA/Pla-1 family phospholipase n=1 Tax=Catenovulum sp. 2E275 TaxID=2980497 RepID=UPI0021D1D411|nr:VolA/Pla-1 family phospholipase [Catenovulum sp. 2E275]MCU4674623.1 lipase [Catenovulum sp. 2E275]